MATALVNKNNNEPHLHATPSFINSINQALPDLRFPVEKEQAVTIATLAKAPPGLLTYFERIPNKRYQNIEDLSSSVITAFNLQLLFGGD